MSVVLYRVKGSWAEITLNRARVRNALNLELMERLRGCLLEAREDSNVVAVEITGSGEFFSAGGDLRDFQGRGVFQGHRVKELYWELLWLMQHLGKPVVAKVNGAALGGGLGLVLASDVVIASEEAEFGTPEVRVGIFPMMIMPLLYRHLGPKRSMELMLSGERIPARRAQEWRLVNRVVSPQDLGAEVEAFMERLSSFSPAVLSLGKEAFYRMLEMPLPQAFGYLQGMLSLNLQLEDAAEGIRAFLAKERPCWRGK